MIKIQETDFFWRFYRRYYKGEVMQLPGNLCNYFWKSVWGIFLWFIMDSNIFLITALLWSMFGSMFLFRSLGGTLFFVLGIVIFGGLGFIVPFIRWINWLKSRGNDNVVGVTFIFIGFIFIGFIVSGSSSGSWSWWNLLWGFGIEIGGISLVIAILGIWYLCFSEHTNLGRDILQYLKAAKDGVCPLVQPPDSFWKERPPWL